MPTKDEQDAAARIQHWLDDYIVDAEADARNTDAAPDVRQAARAELKIYARLSKVLARIAHAE